MKWFEDYLTEECLIEDDVLQGNTPNNISEIADHIDGETMMRFVDEFFLLQKRFSEFVGVGESTIAGWMKSGKFPDYAKRAVISAYFAKKHWTQLNIEKKESERPKVIKNGDQYMIARFKKDEAGVSIGEVIARELPSEKTALIFSSSLRAWELLESAREVIKEEIECREEINTAWLVELNEAIQNEKLCVFAHEKVVEVERKHKKNIRKNKEAIESLAIKIPDNLLETTMLTGKQTSTGEDES
jgi:hypothetical protein